MKLVFKRIRLHNFFSFKDSELQLDDMGYTLISGRNLCKLDNAYSNGAGKSSIINGICFALTGETTQGITTGIENIFANPNDCWVELEFDADDVNFIIRRYKTPYSHMKIYVNGEDKSGKGIKESARILAEYVPDLTSELLSSVIILGQGLPSKFTDNKPVQRKEILEQLTKSDFMIQSIKDKIESRLTDIRTTLRSKEDYLLTVNSSISIYNKQLESLRSNLSAYDDVLNSETDIEDLIKECGDELCIILKRISECNDKISETDSIINDTTDKKFNAATDKASKIREKETIYNESLKDISDSRSTVLADIKSLEKEIEKLKSITDVCPTCGQSIPGVIKPDTSKQENEVAALKGKLTELDKDRDDVTTERRNALKDIEINCNKIIDALTNELVKLTQTKKDLSAEVSELVNSKSSKELELSRLKSMKENYERDLAQISSVTNTISQLEEEASGVNKETFDLNEHQKVVQQLSNLAKREFRGVLLANVIHYINKKVKQYASTVFGSDELSFELNDNVIDISYCGKPFENLSGGEKQRIDVIIQLALRDVLSSQLNIHSNLLVLDEIYDNMDTISCQKITNLVSDLADVDSVFIISHHVQDLEITYDNCVLVTKNEEGISKISYV